MSPDGKTLTMRLSDNWHAHFRQKEIMAFLVAIFIEYGWRRRIIAMPNPVPPILTGQQAINYVDLIRDEARKYPNGQDFEPVPTIQITESTTAEMMRDAFALGVRICKVYPRYVTNNSQHGVVNYYLIYPALAVAEELGMIIQFHAEHPSYDVIGRLKEQAFIQILDDIRKQYPNLKIVVEHVSSAAMIKWVKAQPAWVGASITIQHMVLTSDDLSGYSKRSGGYVRVHLGAFKPGAKDPEDRDAVLEAALSGDPKFWYGGDDAAHLKSTKECDECRCGVWNTIAALSMLISIFIEHNCIERLEAFLSEYGARFFGYPLNEGTITFIKSRWVVQKEYPVPACNDSIMTFFGGEPMDWMIAPAAA